MPDARLIAFSVPAFFSHCHAGIFFCFAALISSHYIMQCHIKFSLRAQLDGRTRCTSFYGSCQKAAIIYGPVEQLQQRLQPLAGDARVSVCMHRWYSGIFFSSLCDESKYSSYGAGPKISCAESRKIFALRTLCYRWTVHDLIQLGRRRFQADAVAGNFRVHWKPVSNRESLGMQF